MLCHIWEPLQQFRKFASHSEHICLTPPRPSVRCQESGEGLPATHMYPPLKSSKGLKPYSLSWKKNNLLYIQNTCSIYIYIYVCVCPNVRDGLCPAPPLTPRSPEGMFFSVFSEVRWHWHHADALCRTMGVHRNHRTWEMVPHLFLNLCRWKGAVGRRHQERGSPGLGHG